MWNGSTTSAVSSIAGAIPSRPTPLRSVTQRGGPSIMAKALLGYVGGTDPRLIAEMRRLQQRVQDLESELVRIQAENDALVSSREDFLGSIDVPQAEPALA